MRAAGTTIRGGIIASILLFGMSLLLPVLRFPSRTIDGWECAHTCIDELVHLRGRVAPAFRALEHPPQITIVSGTLCLAGFLTSAVLAFSKRPTVLWFRMGVAGAISMLAFEIPIQFEDYRSRKTTIDLQLMELRGEVLKNEEVRVSTATWPHFHWSIGYVVWLASFVLMFVTSAFQLFALRKPAPNETDPPLRTDRDTDVGETD